MGNGKGFDASAESLENSIVEMYEAGIIDPVKVTRSALVNAASIAGSISGHARAAAT